MAIANVNTATTYNVISDNIDSIKNALDKCEAFRQALGEYLTVNGKLATVNAICDSIKDSDTPLVKYQKLANKFLGAHIILRDNARQLATQVVLQALKTIHKNSCDEMTRKLMLSVIYEDDAGEGLDLVSAVFCCLYPLVGKDLFRDFVPNDITIGDGTGNELLAKSKKTSEPLTIWRSCLRFVNTIVLANKRQNHKTVYLEEINDNGETLGYVEIPKGFDCDSLDEWDWYDYVIQSLDLTTKQKKILQARFWQGCTITDSAKKAGTSQQNASRLLKAIGEKYAELYESITPYDLDEMPAPPMK